MCFRRLTSSRSALRLRTASLSASSCVAVLRGTPRALAFAPASRWHSSSQHPRIRSQTAVEKDLDAARRLLKDTFGLESFRAEQETVLRKLLAGGNLLIRSPKGNGRSLCCYVSAPVQLIFDHSADSGLLTDNRCRVLSKAGSLLCALAMK